MARAIENELVQSFFEAFGENVKDHIKAITRACFNLPHEQNVFWKEEYSYQGFCFLKVRIEVDWKNKNEDPKFVLKFNKYKPIKNHGTN